MIYFDNNKEAYAYEIENYICKIDDILWHQYANTDKWDIINGEFVDISDTEEYKRKKRQEEAERINNLTMTAWDFVNVLKQAGLTSTQIIDFLNSNPDIQLHLTCCQNVYCGVAKSLMPITYEGITITAEMVEKAFRDKHGV